MHAVFLIHENGCSGCKDSVEWIAGRMWRLNWEVRVDLMDGETEESGEIGAWDVRPVKGVCCSFIVDAVYDWSIGKMGGYGFMVSGWTIGAAE